MNSADAVHDAPSAAISPRAIAWTGAIVAPAIVAPLWVLLWAAPGAAGGQTPAATGSGAILILLVSVASVTDLLWRRIANWATYPAIGWALGLNLWASLSVAPPARLGAIGIDESLLGMVALFVPMQIVSSLSGGGKGDVKLVAAIGALLGISRGLDAVLLSFLVAGAAMLVWALWKVGPAGIAAALWRRVGHVVVPLWVAPPDEAQEKLLRAAVPLAPSLAVGSLLALCEVRFDEALTLVGL